MTKDTLGAVNCEPKPGIPGNPLPVWKHLPLNAKLPIPTKVPKGKAVYCTTKLGSPVTRTLCVCCVLMKAEIAVKICSRACSLNATPM